MAFSFTGTDGRRWCVFGDKPIKIINLTKSNSRPVHPRYIKKRFYACDLDCVSKNSLAIIGYI